MEMTRHRRQQHAVTPTWSSSGRQTGGVRAPARTEEQIAHAIVPGEDFDVVAAARQMQAHRSLAGDALRRALEEADMTTDEYGETAAEMVRNQPTMRSLRSFRAVAPASAAPVAAARTRGRRHSLAGAPARGRQAPPPAEAERRRIMRRAQSQPAMSRNGRPLRRIGSSHGF